MVRELAVAPTEAWLNRSLLQVAAVGALLVPMAAATKLAGALSRNRLETDRAATALAQLGIHECPLAVDRLGGGRSNAVYRIRFADRTLVLKQALSEGTLLALAARWVGPQPFGAVSAAARIGREAHALRVLHAAGVRVPRVIAANIDAGLLLVEHVDGESLPAVLEREPARASSRIRAYAAAIRAAHAAGVALTDGHPGNALIDGAGNITLIDLEFAETAVELGSAFASRCAFDLAYASHYFTVEERRVFLVAVGAIECASDIAIANARLAEFAPLFELERRRQRRFPVQRAA
jgi:aminoglycoside phosphotransferase (APT) family kinase protein